MGKYDSYFINYDNEKWRWPNDPRACIARMDDNVAKGSNMYVMHWVFPTGVIRSTELWTGGAKAAADSYASIMEHPMGGHPPHIHKDAELLFHIGTNPDDPMDLGAEVQMYMGPEMEKHVFNKSTVIWVPPNFIHSPWKPLKTTRSWIFMEVNQGPRHTEKSFRQLLPREVRETFVKVGNDVFLNDDGYGGSEWKNYGF